MNLLRIDPSNRQAVDAFILRQWFSMDMVVHGERIDLSTADGWFVSENDDIIGLITYRIVGTELEILSLDSLSGNRGIQSLKSFAGQATRRNRWKPLKPLTGRSRFTFRCTNAAMD